MRQIRRNVFETNSSSTHSICISKAPVTIGNFIRFTIGEYGWETRCVIDTPSYLYTAIHSQGDSEELLERLKDILDSYHIKYEFEEWTRESYGYIDHGYDTREFIDAVLNDEEMLMRYLFGGSCIYTGNDNSCDHDHMCYAAYDTIWDDDYKKIPNPNHDETKYNYFFKGN